MKTKEARSQSRRKPVRFKELVRDLGEQLDIAESVVRGFANSWIEDLAEGGPRKGAWALGQLRGARAHAERLRSRLAAVTPREKRGPGLSATAASPVNATTAGRLLGGHLDAIADERTREDVLVLCLRIIRNAKTERHAEQLTEDELREMSGVRVEALHNPADRGLSQESLDIAARVDQFPPEVRAKLRDAVMRIADVYRARGRVEALRNPAGSKAAGRTVRPEEDGLAAVIELLPARQRTEVPLVVPDPPSRSC